MEEVYRAVCDGEELVCVIARIEDKKVAELTIGMKEGMMTIKSINVENEFRGMGVGEALIKFAEKIAESSHVRKISLRAYNHDPSPDAIKNLRNWYVKMGYIQGDEYMFKNLEARAAGSE